MQNLSDKKAEQKSYSEAVPADDLDKLIIGIHPKDILKAQKAGVIPHGYDALYLNSKKKFRYNRGLPPTHWRFFEEDEQKMMYAEGKCGIPQYLKASFQNAWSGSRFLWFFKTDRPDIYNDNRFKELMNLKPGSVRAKIMVKLEKALADEDETSFGAEYQKFRLEEMRFEMEKIEECKKNGWLDKNNQLTKDGRAKVQELSKTNGSSNAAKSGSSSASSSSANDSTKAGGNSSSSSSSSSIAINKKAPSKSRGPSKARVASVKGPSVARKGKSANNVKGPSKARAAPKKAPSKMRAPSKAAAAKPRAQSKARAPSKARVAAPKAKARGRGRPRKEAEPAAPKAGKSVARNAKSTKNVSKNQKDKAPSVSRKQKKEPLMPAKDDSTNGNSHYKRPSEDVMDKLFKQDLSLYKKRKVLESLTVVNLNYICSKYCKLRLASGKDNLIERIMNQHFKADATSDDDDDDDDESISAINGNAKKDTNKKKDTKKKIPAKAAAVPKKNLKKPVSSESEESESSESEADGSESAVISR